MDIRIEKVKESDAPFLCTLMNDEKILAVLNELPTALDDWRDAISAWNCDPDEEDYIVFVEETPIGWIGINGLLSDDKTAYIKIVAFLPQYQNLGIGPKVIDQILADLTVRKFEKVLLYTDQENYRAQKCYAKCGFVVAEALTETMANGATVDRYIMERALL